MRFVVPGRLHSPLSARRGISVLEATTALLILTFAVGGLLQILTVSAAQRRASEQRRLALQEVANQAERIALLTWDETTQERLGQLKPGTELAAAAPSATLNAKLTADDGSPAAKRIRIEISWLTPAGQSVEPVALTVWKHQPAEVQP